MTTLEGFPLPPTARHDEHGNHVTPYIAEWRRNPGAGMITGRLVEHDQAQKAQFAEHLAEHRRRGEPAVVIENLED